MRNLGELLDRVPSLVRIYGKWPSFAYLVLATASPSLAIVLVYALLR
jgi:hypothetical protein